ncbi:MAG: molybdopterin-synthase adenylyltransferase MoeB [Deltaproteobacteria bacterium]|nr:molybdopterin-synthase adenylyltransferase MoeB [Deltaproteobacteria bacterium]
MQPTLTEEELRRYSRTITLPKVGPEGQRKLKAASVLLVGVGGLGSPMAMYLAAAGVGRIGIVDPQKVDVTNLQRQVIHDTDMIGRLKVDSARETMLRLNPNIHVDTYVESFTPENAEKIAGDYEILVDGTDNFHTRYLINDLCVQRGKTYVYGSVYRFEGQVSVFDAQKGPCYRCLFPEPPPPDLIVKTSDTGVFSALPGTVGTIQASETLKLILGIGEPLIGKLLLYDALSMTFQIVRLVKKTDCAVCGTEPTITGSVD